MYFWEIARRHFLIRRHEAGDLLENFMVSAVAALLLVRFFLRLTGYPRLGGESLHIAHLLWGGLLMLAAIVILLSSVSRLPVHVAAVVGGIGFGTFIDELGKFITADYDYFFQPAIALIYGLFILLFLVFRALGRTHRPIPQADLVNALELTKEAVIKDLDVEEKRHALALLARCDQDDPVVRSLSRLLSAESADAPVFRLPGSGLFRRFRGRKARLFASAWFDRALLLTVVACAVTAFFEGMADVRPDWRHLTTAAWGKFFSSILILVSAFLGLVRWGGSRARAYRMFLRGALISIFVTQVFAFYREQLKAIVGLAVSVGLWLLLRAALAEEERKKQAVEAERIAPR